MNLNKYEQLQRKRSFARYFHVKYFYVTSNLFKYSMQWRINHDANDAMAWGPPLKGAPRAAV